MPVYAHSNHATPHAANVAALVDDLSTLGERGARDLLNACLDALTEGEDTASVLVVLTGNGGFSWPYPNAVSVDRVIQDALDALD